MNKNIDKNIFNSYETVENVFNNDLHAFYANGRTMKARALKGTSYRFRSDKTGKKYVITPEQCRILNLFYNTWNALNDAQRVDNMKVYYNGNVWWFERAELRRKVYEMVEGYIDAFEAWLNEKNETETVETDEKTADEATETATDEKTADEATETATEAASSEKAEEKTRVVEYRKVEGFDNYMVSSDGKVWSLNYNHTGKMKELKPYTTKDEYLCVGLHINGRKVQKYVHRLVAEAFNDNPDDEPQVNHEDENKANNSAGNLKWCNADYNNNYGTRNERATKANINHPATSAPVLCVETGRQYPSIHEAERQTGVHNTNISVCLNGKRQTAGGFHWVRCTVD